MKHDDCPAPTPEMLAAYVDGQLDSPARDAVDFWLTRHPEARAEIEAHRRLLLFCRTTPPPELHEALWDAALAGIRARLSPGAPPKLSGRRVLRWLGGLTAAAAVIAVVVLLAMRKPEPETIPAPGFAQIEPLPVATADEIEITSIDESDRDTLVVGELPVREPLALLTHDEIRVENINPDAGMNTQYTQDSSVPMIYSVPHQVAPEGKKP